MTETLTNETGDVLLTPLTRLAENNGWRWNARADSGRIYLDLTRDDERLTAIAWLDGRVHRVSGQVAAGIYATLLVHSDRLNERDIQRWVARKRAGDYSNNSGFDLIVQDRELVRETWETASNYTEKVLLPGRYPIELQSANYCRTDNGKGYYAMVRIPAREVKRFYINRVLSASSAHTEQMDEPSTHCWSLYAYQLPDPGCRRELGNKLIVPVES